MLPFIEYAIETSFIKSRNSNTTAINLTFNQQEQPYVIYISGQPSDLAVYKYQDRPVICHNCHKNGHTKTSCKRKRLCRNCGEDDHASDKNNKCPNQSNCANCGEGHMAGSNNCDKEIKERVNKKNAST